MAVTTYVEEGGMIRNKSGYEHSLHFKFVNTESVSFALLMYCPVVYIYFPPTISSQLCRVSHFSKFSNLEQLLSPRALIFTFGMKNLKIKGKALSFIKFILKLLNLFMLKNEVRRFHNKSYILAAPTTSI